MPRPIFTSGERSEWAAGVYNNHHTEVQMRSDVAKVLNSSAPSPAQLEEARGQLASFLRDTLVGLNYAYYEPPGAQALHSNPLLVRSHDFDAETVGGVKSVWQAPQLLGQGSPAGGGLISLVLLLICHMLSPIWSRILFRRKAFKPSSGRS